jgi:hypothetical protein
VKKPVSWLLFAAGVLAAFTTLVHLFAGTPEIQGPLLGSALPQPVILMLFLCWHLVSTALGLSALALLWSALPAGAVRAGALPRFISLLWTAFGLVCVVVAVAVAGPNGLLILPQWILLTPVGVLGLLGDRRRLAAEHASRPSDTNYR